MQIWRNDSRNLRALHLFQITVESQTFAPTTPTVTKTSMAPTKGATAATSQWFNPPAQPSSSTAAVEERRIDAHVSAPARNTSPLGEVNGKSHASRTTWADVVKGHAVETKRKLEVGNKGLCTRSLSRNNPVNSVRSLI